MPQQPNLSDIRLYSVTAQLFKIIRYREHNICHTRNACEKNAVLNVKKISYMLKINYADNTVKMVRKVAKNKYCCLKV